MKFPITLAVVCALLVSAACSQPSSPKREPAPQTPAPPAVPAEFAQAAEGALGAEVEVIVFGDLARTGRQQILAVNRLQKTPTGTVPGLLVTRAVVLEQEGDKWNEIFRADEHLKNPNGYLGATPLAPVSGWRLQHEQHADTGLVMYFTPLERPAGGYIQTIGVRWNPKVKRYQSLDRNFEQFLTEVPSLERVEVPVRR
jgi:hypothetical protein